MKTPQTMNKRELVEYVIHLKRMIQGLQKQLANRAVLEPRGFQKNTSARLIQ